MILKRNNYLWFFILWLLPLYSSCDLGVENNLLIDDDDELEEREIEFSEPVLSEDGRSVVVKARVNGDVGEYDLANPVQLTSTVSEIFSFTRKVGEAHTIQLSEVKNLSKDYIQSHNVKALVLSDLTMSSFAIDQQRRAIRTMRNQFGNNLYVSFLTEDAISETMLATDYVLDHYCIASDLDALNTPIYRAISTKLDEVNDTTSILNQCDLFALFVFTDGIVWSGDMPVDFDHFNIKRHISDLLPNKLPSGENLCDFFSVVYFDDETRFREDDAYLELLAQNSGGVALDTFNWNTILSALWKKLNVDYFDYELSFVNPETKSLRGWGYQVNVSFSSKDTDICQGSFIYNIGTTYSPVIIGGNSKTFLFFQSLLYLSLVLILAYLIMQLLIPYVRYRIFRYMYMPLYTGKDMTWRGHLVGETCYLCKGAFHEGDRIVARCEHTMHHDCWIENEYHCPEFGHSCKTGSHYYDRKNLFSSRNAVIYQPWILISILGGFIVWVLSIYTPLFADLSHSTFSDWVETLGSSHIHKNLATTIMFESLFYSMPPIALVFTFILTALISSLTVRESTWYYTTLFIISRSLLSAFICYILIVFACLVDGIIQDTTISSFIFIFKWALIWGSIMFSVIWHTRIRPRRNWLYASIITFLVGTFIWRFFYMSGLDNRLTLLIAYLIMCIGIGIGVATSLPRSERYVLHVSGAIKEMDIALFNWFKANPHEVVTIGKSVFTTLHMTWDISNTIAPIEANIHYDNGTLKLFPVRDNILKSNGKPFKVGRGYVLKHGLTFVIGKTTFTFIELDR